MALFAQAAAGAALGLFGYNRENYRYDRRQRLMMEMQLAEMRIEQAGLWREDVRAMMGLTPRKLELYLLVIALELNACACALCKGRVPPGSPTWLATCHVLAICSAMMYLILALWFGLHAFVAAQAYKVRILTQIVRLPIPSWEHIEASRTYLSSFEKQGGKQLLRVPIVQRQERQFRQPEVPAANGTAADPWGLERDGSDCAELQPGVNSTHLDRQRHIWHIRQAARFFQAYDAFCRVCMNAGTSALASFFCFFCLSYVLTENAAPMAAWMGMLIFATISIILIGNDLKASKLQFVIAGALLVSSPVLCAIVTFASSRNYGDPGVLEWLMPVALTLKGLWFVYYLYLFNVRETQTGALLPMAFNGVMFLDPFGWAKHARHSWGHSLRLRQGRRPDDRSPPAAPEPVGGAAARPTMRVRRAESFLAAAQRAVQPNAGAEMRSSLAEASPRALGQRAAGSTMPSMACVSAALPSRPEDVALDAELAGEEDMRRMDSDLPSEANPASFAASMDPLGTSVRGGVDVHGEIPGLIPWRYFFINTVAVVLLWFSGAGITAYGAFTGSAVFVHATYGLENGEVADLPMLLGEEVVTSWSDTLDGSRPLGLACDADARVFVSTGRDALGRRKLLHGRLASNGSSGWLSSFSQARSSVTFAPSSACDDLAGSAWHAQDVALKGACGDADGAACEAVVLLQGGGRVLDCSLRHGRPAARLLSQAWLDDRGGEPQDEVEVRGGLLLPEELAALTTAPCPGSVGGGRTADHCLVVGTTGRRVVLLGAAAAAGKGELVPKRLLRPDHGQVPSPGSLALLGGRFLGVLDRQTSSLQVFDLQQSSRRIGAWRLPGARSALAPDHHRRFAALCAGGGAFFALEDSESPRLWRFSMPTDLHGVRWDRL